MLTQDGALHDRSDHDCDQNTAEGLTAEVIHQLLENEGNCRDRRIEGCRDAGTHANRNHGLHAQFTEAEETSDLGRDRTTNVYGGALAPETVTKCN